MAKTTHRIRSSICARCFAAGATRRCSGCHAAYYCNSACQANDACRHADACCTVGPCVATPDHPHTHYLPFWRSLRQRHITPASSCNTMTKS